MKRQKTPILSNKTKLLWLHFLKGFMKKVGNKEEIIEYGAYLVVSASSVNQLRQRRQVILNYFDDMGVEQGCLIFQALSLWELFREKHDYGQHGHMQRFLWTYALTSTSSGNRIGWYIVVDNWIDAVITSKRRLILQEISSSMMPLSEIKRRYRW